MKVAVLAALSVFIALPAAGAGQRHVQNGSPVTTCDNDGHCATLAATKAAAVPARSGRKLKRRSRLPGLSRPRSMPTAIQWVSSYPPRQVHVLALASLMRHDFRPISTIWKPITARACCSWVAFAPATVRRPANIRAGKRWTYVSSGAASLIHAAICPVAGYSARSPLRTVCSKAGAGAIQIMVTRRSV